MLLEVVAKAAITIAKKAGNTSSYYGMYQPREPKELKKNN